MVGGDAFDAVGEMLVQWVACARLVVEMELGERLPGFSEGMEIGGEGKAREFTAEIVGEARAVVRGVQDGIGVVEDLVLGDGRVAALGAELGERVVGDVVDSLQGRVVGGVKDAPIWRRSSGGGIARIQRGGGRACGR